LTEKLARENSANPDCRRLTIQLLFRQAERWAAGGQTEKAIASFPRPHVASEVSGCSSRDSGNSPGAGSLLESFGMPADQGAEETGSGRQFCASSSGYQKLIEDASGAPSYFQEYSWFLATCPDESFRNPALALVMAERGVTLGPEQGECWTALSVAHYRMGNWKKAEAAFQKSIQLRNGGACADWLFLAMTCRQQGDHAQSERWLRQARDWKDRQRSDG